MTQLKERKCMVCHANHVGEWESVCGKCTEDYRQSLEQEAGLYAVFAREPPADVNERRLRKYEVV